MTVDDTLKLKKFPVVVKTDCRNISRIYPLKQSAVSKLFDIASGFDVVKRIYIFGSAVTPKCHIDSDLDICVDADLSDGMKIFDVQKAFGEACDWNCDILMYGNLGNRLRNTIDKEGVLVYEQSAKAAYTEDTSDNSTTD